MSDALLSVDNLITEFETDEGRVRAVDDISFSVQPGETLGIVGESGCGKSVTALSIMRLLPQPMGQIVGGEIKLNGEDLTKLKLSQMEKIRGNKIGMVFQEPMTALNPVHTVGRQLAEVLYLHKDISKDQALRECLEMLDKVGIPSPDVRMGEYPHQLSGGMRQRVVIAMALACQPSLLIADEPTTALDVTIQAQILELIKELQNDMGMAVMLITHDLGVIAETSNSVVVMYAGKVAEQGNVYEIFDNPSHPYTRGLLDSIPKLETVPKSELSTIEGMVPGLLDLPVGCRFENRCPRRKESCKAAPPPIEVIAGSHQVSCYEWSKSVNE
ncbi:MAG: ABC transporter ATP-binding protein [Gammaproteobacteria bacterium]|jgi:peptide/nickel transport system ATP-binding protein|nr:ABC transporter ATP-binding protein [Gammaproteobacteria bacterium]MBT3859108.1 ABC transporter ATP-binding protein [Gammaproteobacteria bacterium]MBT3987108.1 ABC transporter ATP-binding protein [Gammaproteobacteria bacterium]MBT4255205.1 ABC transporter ATP-binding protein [Gammaproteobacteria bacterium]MBT4580527.1 ABC transporter ATP-binding protein [Gammaproteobacteria bacterium]